MAAVSQVRDTRGVTARSPAVVTRVRQGRLPGVDVARGVALLGMTAVHVLPARGADGATTWVHSVADGRASALFAVLAGVGLALLSGGCRPRVDGALRRSIVVRAALVALVGLVLGALDSGLAIILAYYGVLFLVALPLLRLGPRVLAALAVGAAVLTPLLSFALRPSLPARSPGNPTLDLLVVDPLGLLSTLLVTGYYPVLCWTAYLCAGLAVGRLALGSRRVQLGLLAGGAGLAVAASLVSWLLLGPLGGTGRIAAVTEPDQGLSVSETIATGQFGNVPTTTPWWLATDAPHASTPPDLLQTTGSAVAVLGLALLVTGVPLARRLLRPLASAGAMTLTLYSAHVAVVAATVGDRPVALWLTQVVVGLVFAALWLQRRPRGPLEQVVATAAGR
jgi:uncharacterized membrane protein